MNLLIHLGSWMDVDSLTFWSLANPPEQPGRKARTLVRVELL